MKKKTGARGIGLCSINSPERKQNGADEKQYKKLRNESKNLLRIQDKIEKYSQKRDRTQNEETLCTEGGISRAGRTCGDSL